MMMSFPFMKRALISTQRQNMQYDDDMTNIFCIWELNCSKTYEKDQLTIALMGIVLPESFWFKITQHTHTLLFVSDKLT